MTGSLALYENSTGTLFSGRAIYRESLKRLRRLPVSVVYGGHNGVFGRGCMINLD
ncbi:MAG: hypothetical protein ACT4SY_00265 [Hyphomicrobiales bacterium]